MRRHSIGETRFKADAPFRFLIIPLFPQARPRTGPGLQRDWLSAYSLHIAASRLNSRLRLRSASASLEMLGKSVLPRG